MKNRTLLIVIGVILLCCCVVVIGGVVAAPIIRNYLNNAAGGLQNLNPAATSAPETAPATSQPLNGGSSSNGPADGGLGDKTLKTDVWNSILNYENGQNCTDVTSISIDVAQQPDSKGVWKEDWTVGACNSIVVLHITFTPDPKGGTNYDITSQ